MTRRHYSTAAVLGLQAGLAVVVWGALVAASAAGSWLFDVRQASFAVKFFRWQFPLLGAAGAVVIPALLYDRLQEELALGGLVEGDFLLKVLAFPRRAAFACFVTSVFLFTLGAVEMHVLVHSPVEEAIKMFTLGPVSGVVLATLSYLVLSSVAGPLAAEAVELGAVVSDVPTFSIGRKVFLCCVAICVVTLGLSGPIGLTWAERFVEAQTASHAEETLERLQREAVRVAPRDRGAWDRLLRAHLGQVDEIVAVDPDGREIAEAAKPGLRSGFFGRRENMDFLSIRQPGSFASRRDDNLVVSIAASGGGPRFYAATRPDRSTERRLLTEILRMGAAVLVLAILISWAAGRVVAGPLRDLERATRLFAADPLAGEIAPVPADDETGSLSRAFSEMSGSVRAMQARLARSERLAGAAESLAAVAHEVRNPLFGITSTMASLEREIGDEARLRPYFDVVRKESQRLSRLIDEMLTLRAPAPARRVSTGLEAVVRQAAAWIPSRFPEKSVGVAIEAAPDVPPIDADGERLSHVFTNLFENAVLASGEPARIEVRLFRQGAFAVAEISDRGEGIPADALARVFDPFFSARKDGTGLGLSICRRIVEEHGGAIEAENRDGGGSRFRVKIPGSDGSQISGS